MWHDFPFVGRSDRAHALALLLLPFARALIQGPTPLHLFRKPTPRTGATLLVDTIHRIATGGPLNVMTLPEGEEERRRTLTAQLAAAPTYIIFDNLRELSSPAVSAAITSTRWTDRLIRSSNLLDLPVECGWVGTGNNPTLSDEIAGRSVPSHLDARMERPWERNAFKHRFILEWVRDHRVELAHAALLLIQRWIAAGQPLGTRTLGGFESWSRVIGGILESSRPGESHPQALTEPDMNVSAHPALTVQPLLDATSASGQRAPGRRPRWPVSGAPSAGDAAASVCISLPPNGPTVGQGTEAWGKAPMDSTDRSTSATPG